MATPSRPARPKRKGPGQPRHETGAARAERIEIYFQRTAETANLVLRECARSHDHDPEVRAAALLAANLPENIPVHQLRFVRHARAVIERSIQKSMSDRDLMVPEEMVRLRNELANLEAAVEGEAEDTATEEAL